MSPAGSSESVPESLDGLSSAEVLADFQVSDGSSIFVLGCLERRVTLYSQQVRALNLVAALVDEGRITAESKIAIIGGGAAGITAAAAIARAVPNIAELHVYERRPSMLHLQSQSTSRYLHPHIYDWPRPGSFEQDAGLPLLNWSAGRADVVAEQIRSAFYQIADEVPRMRLIPRRRVERIDNLPSSCRLRVEDDRQWHFYDIALLSIGFGFEQFTNNEKNHSYWTVNLLVGPQRDASDSSTIFVSGNGDGGLVDFLIAAFDGWQHHEILDLILSRGDLDDVHRVLQEIETEAWDDAKRVHQGPEHGGQKQDLSLDILQEYKTRLLPVVPSALLKDVSEALRPDANVWFHTPRAQLFRHDTAILNRFAVFLALEADKQWRRNNIHLVTGCEVDNNPLDDEVVFTNGGGRIKPTRRFLRFGTDVAHHEPFLEHINSFKSHRPQTPAAYYPATPSLTPTARKLFPAAVATSSAPHVSSRNTPAADATSPTTVDLCLSMTPDGRVVWSSDLPSSAVQRVWARNPVGLRLRCEMTPEECGPLRFAIARLLAHMGDYQLRSHDPDAWTAFLLNFRGVNRPGPVDFRFHARPSTGDLPHSVPTELTSLEDLASRIHLSLDYEVLSRLNQAVESGLHPTATTVAGWQFEAGLRSKMVQRWREWYPKLRESDFKRRRFLVLLATPDDDSDLDPAGLVRVGPKCIEPHLLGATLFALSFSVAMGPGISPSASFPGNLGTPAFSTHALGVKWLDGAMVGPEAAARDWKSGVVLLSELHETTIQQPILPRLDHTGGSIPGIRDVPTHEQPLILGLTSQMRSAMQIGEIAVRDHFTSVLRERAKAAALMLG